MKKSKYIMFVILSSILLLFFLLNYDLWFSERAIKGRNNVTNSKNICTGMHVDSVILIMGKPDTIIHDGNLIYSYITNDDSYLYGQIHFDTNLKVEAVYFPLK